LAMAVPDTSVSSGSCSGFDQATFTCLARDGWSGRITDEPVAKLVQTGEPSSDPTRFSLEPSGCEF
jgi:hypothetical protein